MRDTMVGYAVLRGTEDRATYRFEIRMMKRPADAPESLVRRYTDGLSAAGQRKVYERVLAMALVGPHSNPERYGDLGDGIYELKVGQHRLPFFYDGKGVIVLTHGFLKRQRKAPPTEVRRAQELRDLYRRCYGG